MTIGGVLLLDLAGAVLLLWILNLVRLGRLYVGYGVIFVGAVTGVLVTVSTPPFARAVARLLGALFPTSGSMVLVVGFLFLMLVYVLSQVTVISNRLSIVVQELAIERSRGQGGDDGARGRGPQGSGRDGAGTAGPGRA